MTGKEALEKARRANRKHKMDKMILDLLSECKQKLSEIKPQPEANRWIPVSERLPEEADRYLCNIKSFAFPGSYYQDILKYDKGGFIEGHIYTDDVTHWMPLPEPPKEGE